ncbi:hypothetical protein BLA3211_05787 [Burkholderia aenigmatica]|uniref:Uncharacterized protein n=1 Tax=Burkholderia aenigmatica TaxID=2015348 RepID=A0A6J5JEA6_9BURK|nr:hypothetical protein BLA3211_05787 [Burkholderia aenigmatica]VWC62329.1 hypothetical protein BLA17378_02486 [Burkholderia aenigmatica]
MEQTPDSMSRVSYRAILGQARDGNAPWHTFETDIAGRVAVTAGEPCKPGAAGV